MKKISIILIFIFVFLLGGFLFLKNFKKIEKVEASSSENITGWAWSNNIGWISMNCYNDFDNDGDFTDATTCVSPNNYGVNLNVDTITGYAWSSNIGWICFGLTCSGTPPSGNLEAKYDSTTKEVSGWAKILNLGDQGWVKLQGGETTVPSSYALCRGCYNSNCDFCYEKSTGDGRAGFNCSGCTGTTCSTCAKTRLYGLSLIDYTSAGKHLEGWAANFYTFNSIGWLKFGYHYEGAPLVFNNLNLSSPSCSYAPTPKSAVSLTWRASNFATDYDFERGKGSSTSVNCATCSYSSVPGLFTPHSSCNITQCSVSDIGLDEGTWYCYKVKAKNTSGSLYSSDSPKSVKTMLCPPLWAPEEWTEEPLITPFWETESVEVHPIDGRKCGEIRVTWKEKEGATGYRIYRSLGACGGINLPGRNEGIISDNVGITCGTCGSEPCCTYLDIEVLSNTKYCYGVKAVSEAGESEKSDYKDGETICFIGPRFEEK